MMDNLFGGLVAGKSSKLTGSGQNPTAIGNLGNSMARVKDKMQLPVEISAAKVIQLEQEMGQTAGEMELAEQIISAQEKLLNDAITLHGKNTDWAAITMRADQKLREIESKHHQQIATYSLGAAKTQAYVDGYTGAYQMSAEIFQ